MKIEKQHQTRIKLNNVEVDLAIHNYIRQKQIPIPNLVSCQPIINHKWCSNPIYDGGTGYIGAEVVFTFKEEEEDVKI